jgi:hypothetical protein
METIGERINHLLNSNKITQMQLEKELGLRAACISEIIHGKNKKAINETDTIEKIACHFKIDPMWIREKNMMSEAMKKNIGDQLRVKIKELGYSFNKITWEVQIPKNNLLYDIVWNKSTTKDLLQYLKPICDYIGLVTSEVMRHAYLVSIGKIVYSESNPVVTTEVEQKAYFNEINSEGGFKIMKKGNELASIIESLGKTDEPTVKLTDKMISGNDTIIRDDSVLKKAAEYNNNYKIHQAIVKLASLTGLISYGLDNRGEVLEGLDEAIKTLQSIDPGK